MANISELARAIANGTYHVSAAAVASKLLGDQPGSGITQRRTIVPDTPSSGPPPKPKSNKSKP